MLSETAKIEFVNSFKILKIRELLLIFKIKKIEFSNSGNRVVIVFIVSVLPLL